MNRNNVISELYEDKNFNHVISMMYPSHLQADLKSETILVICNLPDEKLFGMHERKELVFYAVRVVCNMIKSNRSKFCRDFRIQKTDIVLEELEIPCEELNGRVAKEFKEEKILSKINELYWYKREIVKLYIKYGTIDAVSRETKIPRGAIHNTLKQSINELRSFI